MDRFGALTAFVRAADLGSFAAAGRVLGVTASAVGKAVSALEQEVGVRLLQRSTRNIKLTEEGRLFHERCRRILDDLDDAEASLAEAIATPRGRLRLSTPVVTYHLLMPVLPDFLSLYPEVELDIEFNDRVVDLIDEEVDVAIRSGVLADSRLMSRSLRPFRLILCASPGYLSQHGEPLCPRDLEGHRALRFRFPNSRRLQHWPFEEQTAMPRMKTVLECNNMEALVRGVELGLGIGCMPDFLAAERIRDGRLVSLMEQHLAGPGQFHLLWPSSRHLSPKVRVLVDFLAKRLFQEALETASVG